MVIENLLFVSVFVVFIVLVMSDVVYGAVFRVESGSLSLILIYLGHQFCLNTGPGRIGQILIHRNWVGVKGPRMVKAR